MPVRRPTLPRCPPRAPLCSGDRRRLPSHQAAAALLSTLLAACQLVEELAPAVHRASLQLLAQLAHSFFMPLCLTALAALARIQVRWLGAFLVAMRGRAGQGCSCCLSRRGLDGPPSGLPPAV